MPIPRHPSRIERTIDWKNRGRKAPSIPQSITRHMIQRSRSRCMRIAEPQVGRLFRWRDSPRVSPAFFGLSRIPTGSCHRVRAGGFGQALRQLRTRPIPVRCPYFSSAREINGWKKVTGELPGLSKEAKGKVLVADVPGRFRTLYDDEGMLPRARSAGFIPREGGSRNELHFPKGKLKNWPNTEDVEIVVRPHHAWIVNILPLKSVNEKTQIARTAIDATYAMNKLHFLPKTESCWVENVLEELDEPGEWVLNSNERKLCLWPRNETPVVAPQLRELILLEGQLIKPGRRTVRCAICSFEVSLFCMAIGIP